jgi:peptide/nickel transport system substrate-binding protein
MLEQGDADVVTVNRPEQTQVEGIEGVRIADDLPQLANVGIFMNQKIDTSGGNPDVGSGRLDGNGVPSDFFADVNVRRGVAHAVDYQAAIRDCNRGKAVVGHGPIPRGLAGYDADREWYGTDKPRAEAAFREAHGGRLWETGFTFTVLFNSGNTARQCLAQVVKSGLEGLNQKFKVDVRGVTWAQYLSLYRAGKLPMWIIGWSADYPDPDNFVSPYLHSTGTYASAQSYAASQVDQLIEQGRTETDPGRRDEIYAELQEIAYNDVPTIWLDPVALVVMRSWVQGWYNNPTFPGLYMYPISKG